MMNSWGNPSGEGLYGVRDRNAPPAAVLEEGLERALVVRSGDDEDVGDTRQHECGERVIDQWLVVDGEQLFGYRLGYRVQSSSGTTCQDDSLHITDNLYSRVTFI